MLPYVDFSKSNTVGTTRWLKLETLTYHDQTGRQRLWDRAVRTTREKEDTIDAVTILATLDYPASSSSEPNGATNPKSPAAANGDVNEQKIVIVKQFRPALNAYTLELPAGLIDKNETPPQAGLRELKEECGYSGIVIDDCRKQGRSSTENGEDAQKSNGEDNEKSNGEDAEKSKDVANGNPLSAIYNAFPLSPGLTNENVSLIRVSVDMNKEENKNPQQMLDPGEFCEPILVRAEHFAEDLLAIVEKNRREEKDVKIFYVLWSLAVGIDIGKRMQVKI